MPAPRVRADFDPLQRLTANFRKESDNTQQTLQRIRQAMNTLEGGNWVGKGADKFYAEMNDAVLPSLKRLAAALETAGVTTDKISRIMKQAEDDAAALFRGGAADGHSHDEGEGDGTRQKGGADGIGTGAIAGGIVGGVLGVIGGVGGMAAGAAAGAWVGDKIEGFLDSRSESDAAKAKNDAIRQFINRDDRNGAIQEAIKQHNIDVSKFKSIRYDEDCELDADVAADGSVRIGRGAFRSPGYLASTIGHEALHRDQRVEGRLDVNAKNNSQNIHMNEVEAYDWELKNADKHGLDSIDIKTISRRRNAHYNKLSDENKQRVDDGNYHSVG